MALISQALTGVGTDRLTCASKNYDLKKQESLNIPIVAMMQKLFTIDKIEIIFIVIIH